MSPYPAERKNYVIDTSVLAYHGESIHGFPGQNIYIPIGVLEELDHLKIRMDKVGANCRYVNSYLDSLTSKGKLADGIDLESGQKIFVVTDHPLTQIGPDQNLGLEDTVDNKIISLAYRLNLNSPTKILSRDVSLRVRANSIGVLAEDYNKEGVAKPHHFFLDGMLEVPVELQTLESFYDRGIITLPEGCFFPNQGIVLKSGKSSALAVAVDKTTLRKFYFAGEKGFNAEGITPRSKEQRLAYELLLDPEVSMVSLTGFSGTGKTLLATSAAIKMLHDGEYNKIILSRPAQSTSKDIGFLPGSKGEKLMPWLQPFFDNLEVIFQKKGSSYLQMMMSRGMIEMEALTYIRGRSLPDTIFIIDEAQNITHHEAKAVLTRMGEGSKIILIGDLEQIDSPKLDRETSGLSSVVSLFREFEHSGHVRLTKGERSKLATFAAKVM